MSNERLLAVPFVYGDAAGGAAADAVSTVKLPFPCTLVGFCASLDFVSGSPTGVTVDLNKAGSGVTGFTAVDVGTTAGVGANVKSSHFGGAVAPVAVAADAELDIDVNIAGGTNPKARVTACALVLVGE